MQEAIEGGGTAREMEARNNRGWRTIEGCNSRGVAVGVPAEGVKPEGCSRMAVGSSGCSEAMEGGEPNGERSRRIKYLEP